MPITAKLHNSPNGRNANSSGKPTVATSSSDGWLSVENSRLHCEVARLRRELGLQGQGGGRSAIKPGLPRATRDPADNGPPTPPRRASPRQRTPERGGALANYYEGDWSSVRQPGTQEAAN